eukprot:SAG11_NODE_27327_length_334_cov_0.446809_1_plen_39_part_10
MLSSDGQVLLALKSAMVDSQIEILHVNLSANQAAAEQLR